MRLQAAVVTRGRKVRFQAAQVKSDILGCAGNQGDKSEISGCAGKK